MLATLSTLSAHIYNNLLLIESVFCSTKEHRRSGWVPTIQQKQRHSLMGITNLDEINALCIYQALVCFTLHSNEVSAWLVEMGDGWKVHQAYVSISGDTGTDFQTRIS